MAEPDTPETAQLPASPAATRHQPPPAAGNLNDVYRFIAAANTWTALSPSGSGPSPRWQMGFAATPDGMLYVFGGYDSGTEGDGVGVIGLRGASCAGRSHAACTRCTLLLSLSLAEGMRARREETCTRACMSAARQWATHVPLDRGPAVGWYTLGRETERAAAAGFDHVCVYCYVRHSALRPVHVALLHPRAC
jgi:hypothetical protein